MSKAHRHGVLVMAVVAALALGGRTAHAASASEIRKEASAALSRLYATSATAKALGAKAKGILVFPKIYKAGFIVGGQAGDGAMRKGGKTVAYYRSVAGS